MSRKARRRRVAVILIAALLSSIALFYIVSAIVGSAVVSTQSETDADAAYVEAGGIRTRYREWGEDGLPVLVLIHGFLGSSYDFTELAEGLSGDYHVFAIDLVGFGGSDKPLDFDYGKASQADHLDLVLDALGISACVLGGHSMGGKIALHYVLAHPGRATALILFASAGLDEVAPGPLPRFLYELTVKNYFLQKSGFDLAYADAAVATRARYDRMYAYNASIPAAVMHEFSVDDDSGELAGRLDEVTLPTLVVWGEEDGFIPVANAALFAAAIPGAALTVIEGAGHMAFQERTQETLAAIIAFLTT